MNSIICSLFYLFVLFFSSGLIAAPPVLNKILVADVTDRSFSLIFTSSEDGNPKFEIYSDSDGVNLLDSYESVSYPLNTGDVFSLSQNQNIEAQQLIVNAAKALGIVKLNIHGLASDTLYYIKYGFDSSITTESTLCPDAGSIYCPDLGGTLLEVRTNKQQTRSLQAAQTETLFNNDILLVLKQNVVIGELIIMTIDGARYPVSLFAGDGMPLPYVLIDTNNFSQRDQASTYVVRGFDEQTSGNYGESLSIRRYRGQANDVMQLGLIGNVSKSGGLIDVVDRSIADCNADGQVNGYDSLVLQHVINENISSAEYSKIAFHPLLCNLFVEERLNGVNTEVNIDASDFSRLSDVLVNKTKLENLPEVP